MMALSVILAVGCLMLLFLFLDERKRHSQDQATKAEDREELQKLISELRGELNALSTAKQAQLQTLEEKHGAYQSLATQWNERIASIDKSLTSLREDASQKVEDLASQLKPIVSIFRSPQVAGIEFGEAELEMLLKTHLGEGLYIRKPRQLGLGQDVVDFAIKLPDCLVPIDSKFPSLQYRAWVEAPPEQSEAKAAWRAFRDQMVKQMETTAKYIKPDAGTTDYALIFVPSDVIYQQAFLTQRVYEQENPIPQRSQQLQVFGCSPQTLMPMFGLIRLGLRNLKIAEDVKGIRAQIDELNNVFFKSFLDSDWKTLRLHVRQLSDHVDKLASEKGSVSRISESIRKLTNLSHEHESEAKPAPASPTPESAEWLALQKEN